MGNGIEQADTEGAHFWGNPAETVTISRIFAQAEEHGIQVHRSLNTSLWDSALLFPVEARKRGIVSTTNLCGMGH